MDKEPSEIAKLTGRISKDPKSKLFVPLAEEYKKTGDIEMAIYVLLEGLKSNPDYVTARSSLGKLLLAKGDLEGAQKEFEEVVKTNPDNLLAQKKLGDLFILRNRPLDAIPHYKIALSLNPGDAELASLILDVEEGRDVRSKFQMSKAKTTDDQAVKQEPPASAAAPEPAPGPVPPQPANVEPRITLEASPVSEAVSTEPLTKMAPAPELSMTETEEPEEVLVVEPLEPENSAQEPQAASNDLPGEHERPAVPLGVADESFDFDFQEGDQHPDEPVASQDIRSETGLIEVEDGETIPTAIAEETASEEIIEAGFGEEVLEPAPGPLSEDSSGKSDDFTTDTLAELYISQGFFEKAIEIYERMLVDKPNSQGLQDKLSWVRSEFARTVTPAPEEKKEENIFDSLEAGEYAPVVEDREIAGEPPEEPQPQQKDDTAGFRPDAVTESRKEVPAIELEEAPIEAEILEEPDEIGPEKKSSEENSAVEPGEDQPIPGPNEQTTAGGDAGFEVLTDSPARTQAGSEPKLEDFEPREYVPPAAEPERTTRDHRPGGRKETIARLETWLTTIKKEK